MAPRSGRDRQSQHECRRFERKCSSTCDSVKRSELYIHAQRVPETLRISTGVIVLKSDPDLLRPMEHLHLGALLLGPPLQSRLIRRAYKRAEQGMRLERLRFELGMELAADEMGMIRQLDHFHVSSIRSRSRNPQPRRRHRLFVL